MKQLSKIVWALLLLVLSACEPQIYFEEPQPTGISAEKQFDQTYRGRYESATEAGNYLEIDKNGIESEWWWEKKMHRSELDSLPDGYEWKNNTLFISGKRQKTNIVGDTIVVSGITKDTFFKISNENVLTAYKGHYFLNLKNDSGWNVYKISLTEKGDLMFGHISNQDEIRKLQAITPVDSVMTDSSDAVRFYTAKPSQGEFDDILNGSFFEVSDVYRKIR